MAKSKRPRSNRDEFIDDGPPVSRIAKRRPVGSKKWLLGLVGIVAVGVLLAPTFLAGTSYVPNLVNRILPVNGQIHVESTSLGWWSPVVLRNVTVTDPHGDVVGKIAAVSGNRSLFSIVLNSSELGTFTLAHPVFHAVLRADGSNLEDLIQPILAQPKGAPKSLEIIVSEGVLAIDDITRREKYEFNNLDADVKLNMAGSPLAVDVSGMMPTKTDPAKFKVAFANGAGAAGKGELTLDGLPLPILEPLLRRQLPGVQLDGDLHARLNGQWGQGADNGQGEVTGSLELHDVALTADAIHGDVLQLSRVRIPVHLLQNGQRINIDKLTCESDIGELTATGQLELTGLSAAEVLASLTRQPCKLSGEIDLAKIAKMLPKTLVMRQDTELISGRMQVELASATARDRLAIRGSLTADNLTARTNGRTITWRQPLLANIDAHQENSGLVVDHLQCDSSFLTLDAAGKPERGRADINYDLSKLVAELSRFFELGSLQLAGRGKGQIDWQTDDRGRFAIDGQLNTRDFQFVTDQRRAWSEPQLAAIISGQGVIQDGALSQLEKLSVTFDAGDERFKLALREPADLSKAKVWPLTVRWQGDLAQWLPRLEPSLPQLRDYDLVGNGNLSADVDYSPQQIALQSATFVADGFRLIGGGWFINERQINLAGAGIVDPNSGETDVSQLKISAGDTVAQVKDFRLRRDRRGWQATGDAKATANLAQLAAWRSDPRVPPTTDLSGRLDCQTSLTMADSLVKGVIDGRISNLQMADLRTARQARQGDDTGIWRERQIDLQAKGDYDPTRGELRLQQGNVAADALELNLAGKITSGRQQDEIDLAGKIKYDWQRLAPVWQQYLGPQIQIAGQQSRDFALRGRIANGAHNLADMLRDLRGQIGVGWDQALAYGLPIGRTDLNVQLDNGNLQVSPLVVDISGGKLSFAPQFLLAEQPPRMMLPKGPILSHIQLTPEICKRGLKFVAPLLAETTVARGEFSVNLAGATIPLSDPAGGMADGNLLINAEVKPGPIMERLTGIVTEIEQLVHGNTGNGSDFTLVKLDQGDIQFRMVDRKVYHQGVKMNLGPALLTTRGYVSLDDDSINMLAVLDLPEAWGSKSPVLGKIFQNLQVQIPITGTTSRPQLDANIVRNMMAQAGQSAAKNMLLDKVQEGLGKALPGALGTQQDPNTAAAQGPLQDVLQGFRNLVPPRQ
jgi:hypothetical protein